MITCYIIDDELHAIQVLEAYIAKTPGLEVIGFSENPLEAMEEFRNKKFADLTFVDIDMPQLSGIEVSELIGTKTRVIFTTAFSSYAVEAFEKDVYDYILKPITYPRFLKCINKVTTGLSKEDQDDYFYLQCDNKGKIVKLKYDDILFVEGLKNYIGINTVSGKYITHMTMKEMEENLSSVNFCRIHKSYIVNLDKITNIQGNLISLGTKMEITLGSDYKEDFNKKISKKLLKSKRSTN
jgi:DNA-binding LytR/AlgR family response regulator